LTFNLTQTLPKFLGSLPAKGWGWIVLMTLGSGGISKAQNFAANATILAEARVTASPQRIELKWPLRTDVSSYRVIRRTPSGQETTATVAGDSTGWLDADSAVGVGYEYRLRAIRIAGTSPPFAYANLFAAIDLPLVEDKGHALLVVEDRLVPSIQADLLRWEQDVTASGYIVSRLVVSADTNPAEVRTKLQTWAAGWSSTAGGSVFLVGRVPQPYSGNIYPDGHTGHRGAWPTDGYYADLDGVWTDNLVNSISATRVENRNVIGDGKFDQSSLPSNTELMVGRLDLSRLPAFPQSEVQLLQRYFAKDHAFRTGSLTVGRRAVIDDNFAYTLAEAPSATARSGSAAAVGVGALADVDFITGTAGQSALMGTAFGYGDYTDITGAFTTAQCVSTPPEVMFTLGFGSYFGDYDTPDNVLRAVLAAEGCSLASTWTGRPEWQLQHLGLGFSLGYSARVSQNAASLSPYYTGYFARSIHVNLLGDPTLELFPAAPVLSATTDGGVVNWLASQDASRLGFAVYRRSDPSSGWVRQTANLLAGTTWTDPAPTGFDSYLVKSIRRETTGSGTYLNASIGVLAMPGFPTVSLSAVPSAAQEYPRRPAVVRVSRDCVGATLSVALDAPLGSAVEGVDYSALPRTVSIPSGEFFVDVAVPAVADGVPEGTETIELALSPDPGYGQSVSAVNLTVEDNPYESWCRQHFGLTAAPTTVGPEADPDLDGLSNLMEFGMGTLPLTSNPDPMSPPVRDNLHCVTKYLRRANVPGLIWQCQSTCDLNLWVTNPADIQILPSPLSGGMESVEVKFPLNGPRCFIRVRVVAAPDFFPAGN
jgi:hypothetical protein